MANNLDLRLAVARIDEARAASADGRDLRDVQARQATRAGATAARSPAGGITLVFSLILGLMMILGPLVAAGGAAFGGHDRCRPPAPRRPGPVPNGLAVRGRRSSTAAAGADFAPNIAIWRAQGCSRHGWRGPGTRDHNHAY